MRLLVLASAAPTHGAEDESVAATPGVNTFLAAAMPPAPQAASCSAAVCTCATSGATRGPAPRPAARRWSAPASAARRSAPCRWGGKVLHAGHQHWLVTVGVCCGGTLKRNPAAWATAMTCSCILQVSGSTFPSPLHPPCSARRVHSAASAAAPACGRAGGTPAAAAAATA